MVYQLPNGKVIYLTIDQFLDLTDDDIQYLTSVNAGEHGGNPFTHSAVVDSETEKCYDFDFLVDDENQDDDMSDDQPFDDIVDITGPLDN